MARGNSRLISVTSIRDFVRRLNRTENLGIDSRIEEEFSYAVEAARQQVGAEKYALWMIDDDGKLRVKAHYGLSEKWNRLELSVGESISGTAVEQKKTLPIEDITKGLLVNGKVVESLKRKYEETDKEVMSALVVPLIFGGKAVGTFNAYNAEIFKWSKYQEIQMETIAEIAASAITLTDRNERIQNHVADITHNVVSALLEAIGEKSSWTYEHQERVYHEMWRLVQKLNLPLKTQRQATYAARLHDLGKFSIGDAVLDKKEQLTDDEWKNMRLHTLRGVKIISKTKELDYLIPGIRDHHEREDGSGYPAGKKGDEIELVPKMIGVIDSCDAMANPRPYKQPMPLSICIDELCMCSKLPYDKDRLKLFRTLEKMQKSEQVEEHVREKIRLADAEDVLRCYELPEVKDRIDDFWVDLQEPEHEQYCPEIVVAYAETLKDRRLID